MFEKEKIQKTLSDRLKKARMEKGLTQPELAKIIGSTDRNISNYETGYSFPSIVVLYKISIALSTSVDYLFGFTEDPTIHESDKQLTDADFRILEQLKKEEELYEYLKKNTDTGFHYINEIWKLLDKWKRHK